MNPDTIYAVLRVAGNVVIVAAAVIGLTSVYVHTRVDWMATQMGRHLMAYMAVIAATLALAVIRMLLGDSTWFALLRLAVFVGVPIVMGQRLYLQIKAQVEDAQDSARGRATNTAAMDERDEERDGPEHTDGDRAPGAGA